MKNPPPSGKTAAPQSARPQAAAARQPARPSTFSGGVSAREPVRAGGNEAARGNAPDNSGDRPRYRALVDSGACTAAQYEQALKTAGRDGVELEFVLARDLGLTTGQLGAALSTPYGVPYEPYRPDRPRPVALLANLKRDYAGRHQWLPVEDGPAGLVVLASDPEQSASTRIINAIFPRSRPVFRVTTRLEFQRTLEQFFDQGDMPGSVDDMLLALQAQDDDVELSAGDISAASQNELVRLVNRIIVDAHARGASDIHIEPAPGREKTVIRFRRDGAMEPYIEIPASYRKALTARIKIMCDLDIAEHRRPQDGKIRFRKYGPLDIELRVATVPTTGGLEDVVLRLLNVGAPVPLDQLGILAPNLARLKQAVEKPHGIFFVCGPTGAGKTTTLHSVLQHLNKPDTKIWTAEDPVEITQKGLRQVQVNRKTGLDFATVMRAFLRADPDIIMVGEMRDRETVAIGLEASLTGHLVFATLHTNSAPESIVRLLDMGMDAYNFSDALLGILAQRLARRLCPACRQAYAPARDELLELAAEYAAELAPGHDFCGRAGAGRLVDLWLSRHAATSPANDLLLYRATGCRRCGDGYQGRVGLHELMTGSARVKRLIVERAPQASLLAAAQEEGMLTLKMDGVEKVLGGQTDLKQVRHVCSR